MTFAHFKDRNVNIHYEWINSGKQRTYIFINVLGTDLRIWDEVVHRLKWYGNILRYDKQGHGLSSLLNSNNTLAYHATDLALLMARLKISKAHLVGLSVGGLIAQLMAFNQPELIDKLILAGTRHKIGNADGWNTRIQQVQEGGIASVSDSILQKWFSTEFQESRPEVIRGIKTMVDNCSPEGYIKTCMAIRDTDLTESTKKINRKTLVMVGSKDGSTTPSDVKSMADLIPGSRFEIIPGSGHLPCIDNPEKMASLILNFTN